MYMACTDTFTNQLQFLPSTHLHVECEITAAAAGIVKIGGDVNRDL
jgi:hypothetical protein